MGRCGAGLGQGGGKWEDSPHQMIVVSFAAATRVLWVGDTLFDISDACGLDTLTATVACGGVADWTMAQVSIHLSGCVIHSAKALAAHKSHPRVEGNNGRALVSHTLVRVCGH